MNMLTAEQSFLLALSHMVWNKRGAAKAARLPFNEETITETILLDLQIAYPGHVRVIAFNKIQEANTGADWLWSFINVSGSQSFTMLVQAKRLEDAEQIYSGINRYIGKRSPPTRQIDQLLATAKAQGVPALYSFYNHVSQTSRVPRTCGSLPPGNRGHIDGFGISLADAHAVKAVVPDETFDTHRGHSMPLHCLLCSRGSGVRSGSGTPEMVASGIARLRVDSMGETPDPGTLGMRQGLHPMVRFAIDLAADRGDSIDYPESDEIPGIAGVVVLQDAELEERQLED